MARAAHEDDHAVARDPVLLGLQGIDVEVVVGDLELRRLASQVLHVVVDLFADLAPLGEELGDLDRLVEVAHDPPRHLARAGGAEVGQVDLLVALRGDVGDRDGEDQRRRQAEPGVHRVADAAGFDLGGARDLRVGHLDQRDRPGGRQPDRGPEGAESGRQPRPGVLERLPLAEHRRQVRLQEVERHRQEPERVEAEQRPLDGAAIGSGVRGPSGAHRQGGDHQQEAAHGRHGARAAGADHPFAEEDGQHADAPQRRPAGRRLAGQVRHLRHFRLISIFGSRSPGWPRRAPRR